MAGSVAASASGLSRTVTAAISPTVAIRIVMRPL
jgi:hypothetical protein